MHKKSNIDKSDKYFKNEEIETSLKDKEQGELSDERSKNEVHGKELSDKNLKNKEGKLSQKGNNRMPAIAKVQPKTVKRLFSYILRYKVRLIFVVICILTAAFASVKSATFIETLIDDHIIPLLANDSNDFSSLLRAIIQLATIFIVGIIANFTYRILMVEVSQGTLKKIRDEMFHKMQDFPIKYFDTNSNGDIMSHYTNDADTLMQMISESLPQLFATVVTVTAIFIAMLSVSIPLTLIIVVTLILMMKFTKFTAGKSGGFFMKQQQVLGDLNGYVEEMVNGLKVVKVFCYEERSKEKFTQKNELWRENSANANMYSSVIMPAMHGFANLQYVGIAIIGGYMAINGAINFTIKGIEPLTLGMIAAFLTLSRNFTNPIAQVSNQVTTIVRALAGATRIFALMDEEIEEDEGKITLVNLATKGNPLAAKAGKHMPSNELQTSQQTELQSTQQITQQQEQQKACQIELQTSSKENSLEINGKIHQILDSNNFIEVATHTGTFAWKEILPNGNVKYTKLRGDVVFKNVDFSYNDDKQVLYDICMYAEPGQKVAFVGATGAGKTTITNLINRFYDIKNGSIEYDGIDIKKISKNDLRRSLGVVLQDVNLFTGTVMDNIRYGKPSATDEECINAAKLSNAHNFIEMLPKGYETILEGDGSGLSQGQRQLISIARAAVADPPVMILDEATSSIDTRTEALVQKGMDRLMEGRTVFVIAHRLSTVKNSDVIMVMENGRIIERGDHKRLIEEKGKYYQLYTGAFEME